MKNIFRPVLTAILTAAAIYTSAPVFAKDKEVPQSYKSFKKQVLSQFYGKDAVRKPVFTPAKETREKNVADTLEVDIYKPCEGYSNTRCADLGRIIILDYVDPATGKGDGNPDVMMIKYLGPINRESQIQVLDLGTKRGDMVSMMHADAYDRTPGTFNEKEKKDFYEFMTKKVFSPEKKKYYEKQQAKGR